MRPIHRNNRTRLSLESLEQRDVMVAGFIAGEVASYGISYGLDSILEAAGVESPEDQILSELADIKVELQKINQRLDGIEANTDSLVLSSSYQALRDYADDLKLVEIDSLWNDFETIVNTINNDGTAGVSQNALNDFADRVIDALQFVPAQFDEAFQPNATNGNQYNVIATYSNILKQEAGGYLTSTYSAAMDDAFDSYTVRRAEAVFLLANAYHQTDSDVFADDLIRNALPRDAGDSLQVHHGFLSPDIPQSLDTVTTNQQNRWNEQIATMPTLDIPDGVVLDTKNNLLWNVARVAYDVDFRDAESQAASLDNQIKWKKVGRFGLRAEIVPDGTAYVRSESWRLPSVSELVNLVGISSTELQKATAVFGSDFLNRNWFARDAVFAGKWAVKPGSDTITIRTNEHVVGVATAANGLFV